MNIDLSTLGPLAGSLARAGLPALSMILGAVIPPPFDLIVKPAFSAISWAMGVDPASPTAVTDVQAKVDADPSDAAAKLQAVEAAHKDIADAAQAELEARLKDTQDARATETKFIEAGSPIAWAPVVISTIVVTGFYWTIWALFHFTGDLSQTQANLLNILFGAEIPAFAGVIQFWTGSSAGSQKKDTQIGNFLQSTAAPVGKAVARKVAGR